MVIGEVRTDLLRHSVSIPVSAVERLLALVEGGRVVSSRRPTSYVVSAEMIEGVDCLLPAMAGRRVRGVGTVATHAIVCGGRVVQSSASARIEQSAARRRQVWSHYLAHAGRIETLGALNHDDMVEGFLRPPSRTTRNDTLSLENIAYRAVERVQTSDLLDGRAPFRTVPTRLRWAATVDERYEAAGRVIFTVDDDGPSTVELAIGPQDAAHAQGLCEDLALHDWLLATVTDAIERATTSSAPKSCLATRLRPIIEHLPRVWMPGARVAPELSQVWDAIDRRPGFSRQWVSSLQWLQNQVMLGTTAFVESRATTPVQSRCRHARTTRRYLIERRTIRRLRSGTGLKRSDGSPHREGE